jgi:hypothetical protein
VLGRSRAHAVRSGRAATGQRFRTRMTIPRRRSFPILLQLRLDGAPGFFGVADEG